MFLKNNSSGFTLVEVAIAMGISSVVLLGVGSAFKISKNSNKNVGKIIDKNEYFNEISKTINNRLTCAETLSNLTIGASVVNIKKNGTPLYFLGQKINQDTTLTSIKIEQNPNWAPVSSGYGPASLKIDLTENGKTITKFFPVSVQLDSNKKIIGCSQKLELGTVNSDMYKQLCTDVVGGTPNGSNCTWTRPVQTVVTYLPAPEPEPEVAPTWTDPLSSLTASTESSSCYGPICDLYTTILGRMPDAGGKSYWEERLSNGDSLATITAEISHSDEASGRSMSAETLSNYQSDITARGMTLEQAFQRCGVDLSC